jgi:hypothetical protein
MISSLGAHFDGTEEFKEIVETTPQDSFSLNPLVKRDGR